MDHRSFSAARLLMDATSFRFLAGYPGGETSHGPECSSCGTMSYGSTHCIKCDGQHRPRGGGTHGEVSDIAEYEKIYCEVCDECQEELQTFRGESENGGIYWRCVVCKNEGVIKKSEYATQVRKAHGPEMLEGPPYLPCGLEFAGPPDCPAPPCQEERLDRSQC